MKYTFSEFSQFISMPVEKLKKKRTNTHMKRKIQVQDFIVNAIHVIHSIMIVSGSGDFDETTKENTCHVIE